MAGKQIEPPRKLWEHPDPKSSAMYQFMQNVNTKFGLKLQVRDSCL